ncbi:magnesium transporter NIPA-domain-containing protein [Mrakia frigida]|uniref:magnesium transporter NIPA-domain-containing protein n=1 Tax=Mrakia frigida TaxID=29902 RepID=UPI003FCBEEFC
MVEDKYIGLALAVSSSAAIGTSYIITKKGLNDAGRTAALTGNSASDNLAYLKNPTWWAGITTLVIGEICNFSAYTFAPPILVTPLGALSVIIGAILASFLLDEKLGRLGICGCACCLIGSLIIVLHAPADKEVETVDEIWEDAMQPGFLTYLFFVTVFSLVMIYKVAPVYGKKNPVIYTSICSVVGSISVMAIKGLGVAVKLTFAGNNQFTHPTTYLFGLAVAGCIMVQMNYLNKALDTFPTNVVNPMYYVFFSTATIIASLVLFQGLGTPGAKDSFSLLCGFLVIFMGVYLLNLSRDPEPPHRHGVLEAGLMQPRISIAGRYSVDDPHEHPLHSAGHGRRSSLFRQQSNSLFDAFNEESVGLTDLQEEEDDDTDQPRRTNNNNSASAPLLPNGAPLRPSESRR